MFGALGAIFSSLISGVMSPLFTWLNKKQDTQLEGFKTASGVDLGAYQAFLNYQAQVVIARLAASSWWGARVLFMIIGTAVALHVSLVFVDSSLPIAWVISECPVLAKVPTFRGPYGCLGVPEAPALYITFEQWVVAFLFGGAAVGQMASTVGAWLGRK